ALLLQKCLSPIFFAFFSRSACHSFSPFFLYFYPVFWYNYRVCKLRVKDLFGTAEKSQGGLD
ncbi:MAG: hypothetical protein IKN45_03025, partial [Lachnospiraceae bacterium]|nr:hypothetical protein [Lachnospiraceae bacterium]